MLVSYRSSTWKVSQYGRRSSTVVTVSTMHPERPKNLARCRFCVRTCPAVAIHETCPPPHTPKNKGRKTAEWEQTVSLHCVYIMCVDIPFTLLPGPFISSTLGMLQIRGHNRLLIGAVDLSPVHALHLHRALGCEALPLFADCLHRIIRTAYTIRPCY